MKSLILSLAFIISVGWVNAQPVPKPAMWWNYDGVKCIDSFTLLYNKWTKLYAAQVSFIRYDLSSNLSIGIPAILQFTESFGLA